jgi:hypothetical protein
VKPRTKLANESSNLPSAAQEDFLQPALFGQPAGAASWVVEQVDFQRLITDVGMAMWAVHALILHFCRWLSRST